MIFAFDFRIALKLLFIFLINDVLGVNVHQIIPECIVSKNMVLLQRIWKAIVCILLLREDVAGQTSRPRTLQDVLRHMTSVSLSGFPLEKEEQYYFLTSLHNYSIYAGVIIFLIQI